MPPPTRITADEYDDGFRPFIYRTEHINVAGGGDRYITVRSSHHGAVITDNDAGSWGDLPGPLALRWVSTDPSVPDTTIEAFIGFNFASDWASFRAALALYVAPSQNFVFADVKGNIGACVHLRRCDVCSRT